MAEAEPHNGGVAILTCLGAGQRAGGGFGRSVALRLETPFVMQMLQGGMVKSSYVKKTNDNAEKSFTMIPKDRGAEVTKVISPVRYLAHHGAAFITGQVFSIDGESSMPVALY